MYKNVNLSNQPNDLQGRYIFGIRCASHGIGGYTTSPWMNALFSFQLNFAEPNISEAVRTLKTPTRVRLWSSTKPRAYVKYVRRPSVPVAGLTERVINPCSGIRIAAPSFTVAFSFLFSLVLSPRSLPSVPTCVKRCIKFAESRSNQTR